MPLWAEEVVLHTPHPPGWPKHMPVKVGSPKAKYLSKKEQIKLESLSPLSPATPSSSAKDAEEFHGRYEMIKALAEGSFGTGHDAQRAVDDGTLGHRVPQALRKMPEHAKRAIRVGGHRCRGSALSRLSPRSPRRARAGHIVPKQRRAAAYLHSLRSVEEPLGRLRFLVGSCGIADLWSPNLKDSPPPSPGTFLIVTS